MGCADVIEKKRRDRIERLRKEYINELKKISTIIKKFQFKKIYLFGSFLEKNKFHFNSDVDLAVEGMKEEDFLKFYGRLLRKLSIPLDLKMFEELSPEIKKAIKKRGKVLYEKK